MKKLILCGLAAAVTAQIWGMISWMVLPWHMTDFKQFKSDSAVMDVIRNEAQGTGLYTLPNMDPTIHEDESKKAAWDESARKGPFAFISVRTEGIEPGMGPMMAIGFALNFVIGMILFWLVSNSSITCPKGRTVFIAVAGTVGALYPHISNWNWWYFPLTYCLVGVVDLLITWGLAGFVIVKLSDKLGAKAES